MRRRWLRPCRGADADADVDPEPGQGTHPQDLPQVAGIPTVVAQRPLQLHQGRGRRQGLHRRRQLRQQFQDLLVGGLPRPVQAAHKHDRRHRVRHRRARGHHTASPRCSCTSSTYPPARPNLSPRRADRIHIGDCRLARKNTKPLNRDQARHVLTTGGIGACEVFRPESDLGIFG
ncbi:DUF6233 domain-containing protein [Streptomyces sp. NBC_00124]|uniref:DUF6233 domain-containing protein n=1 Tax=Streptomyces sp. NBC_00124 TaxID=2975662 RepID=UPI00338E96BD